MQGNWTPQICQDGGPFFGIGRHRCSSDPVEREPLTIEQDGLTSLVGGGSCTGCPSATGMLAGPELQTAREIAWLKAFMATKKRSFIDLPSDDRKEAQKRSK
jgi:hypothetical protein